MKLNKNKILKGSGVLCLDRNMQKTIWNHESGGSSRINKKVEARKFTDKLHNKMVLLLKVYFAGPKYKGRCDKGIDSEDADFIDVLLKSFDRYYYRVDRTMLTESMDSWIYVNRGNKTHFVMYWDNVS